MESDRALFAETGRARDCVVGVVPQRIEKLEFADPLRANATVRADLGVRPPTLPACRSAGKERDACSNPGIEAAFDALADVNAARRIVARRRAAAAQTRAEPGAAAHACPR